MNNINASRFASLLKSLDVAVLSYREVRAENQKFRIDDGYFSKLAVATQRRIEAMPHIRLGDASSTFRKGIFDIKADTYQLSGVPFVRIGDLANGLIDENNLAYITQAKHEDEHKTALTYGDIILSKTAYPAAAFVNLRTCNVSQDTIGVRLARTWRGKLYSGYVVTFLNTTYGLALMQRQFQGNVQLHLSLPDAKQLPIPLFEMAFQKLVHAQIERAHELLAHAEAERKHAEDVFLEMLGLGGWNPSETLYCIRRSSEVFRNERIDAEHYREKFYAAKQRLKAAGATSFVPLGNMLATLTNGHTPLRHDLRLGEVPFLCAEHVSNFEVHYGSKKRITVEQHRTELARTALREGDVLLTIKGKVGNAALVEAIFDNVNINQDVALLRLDTEMPVWFVLAFLNSIFGRLQVEQLSTGGINPFLGLGNVRKIEVPKLAPSIMSEIAQKSRQKVHEALRNRHHAEKLLRDAKKAVEIAIEQNEKAALSYISRGEQ